MCFSQPASGAFAALGLFVSWWLYARTSNTRLAVGVFFFFTMEFLQFLQYFIIDDCDSIWNKVLTFLGYAHICAQPYFTHVINSSLTKSPKILDQYKIVLRLCAVGGLVLLVRFALAYIPGYDTFNHAGDVTSTEWLRGEKLCTFSGKFHLAWAVPMADPSYYIPGVGLHSFLMFVPFFIIKRNMIIQGVFLFITGPFLASFITNNLFEQASVWCFFSIAQISIMIFLIRETLLINWKKGGKESVYTKKGAQQADALKAEDAKKTN